MVEFEDKFLTKTNFEESFNILKEYIPNLEIQTEENEYCGNMIIYLAHLKVQAIFEIKFEEDYGLLKISLADYNITLKEQEGIAKNVIELFKLILTN